MSLNDPQWGKRGGGGRAARRISTRSGATSTAASTSLFGRKTGGDADNGGGRPAPAAADRRRGAARRCWSLVVWLASGFYIVDEGRRGVVTRFGKYTETTQPGPRWHLPFPIEAVEVVDFSQVKTIEIGYRNTPRNKVEREAVMLTDDENIIDIQFAVQYNLKSAEDYVFNNRRPDQIVSVRRRDRDPRGHRQEQDGLRALRRPRADREADRAADAADARPLPAPACSSRRSRCRPCSRPTRCRRRSTTRSRRGQDRERLKNEGQAYANDVVPRARGMASRLLEEANGYTTEVVQRAEGDASRFRSILVEYQKAPGVTRDRLYLDMMQSVLGNDAKVARRPEGAAAACSTCRSTS